MMKVPPSNIVTRVLIIINAVFWFVFASIIAAGAHPSLPEGEVARWIMAGLSLITCVVLLGLLALLKRTRLAYYLLLGLLSLIAVLTITDEFGLADLAVLIMTSAPIILLLKDRVWYNQELQSISQSD
jgi:hypothetical protein